MAAGNVFAALVVTVVFSGVTWQTPWRGIFEAFLVALLDARLAMLFGDRASMRVDSRAGHTGITLDVPS